MRLSLKLAGIIGVGAMLIVLVMSIRSIQRDVQLVEEDLRRDAALVAMAVAGVIEHAEGAQDWGAVLGTLGLEDTGVQVQWRPNTDQAHARTRLTTRLTADEVEATMPLSDGTGEIVVRESLWVRDQVIARSMTTVGLTIMAVIIIALAAGLYVGQLLVGRPVSALVNMARRVAREDYSQQIERFSNDELGVLATEFNLMASQLKWARDQNRAHAEARYQAQLQLLHADRLRTVGQLAAGLAHELGTPLNVISGRAALLSRALDRLDVDSSDAQIIRSQTEQITEIVRRLMRYAHPAPNTHEAVSLYEICQTIIGLLKPMVGGRQVTLNGSTTACVHGAPDQLQQVITNLLMNAIQATQPEGAITLTLHTDTQVELIVDDDGPGISEDDQRHVFDPFFTTKDPGEGTGLGLSIVHGIVQEHGGQIHVQRAPSGGARFVLTLPKLEAC